MADGTSIDDLFAQLACAQEAKAKARLSERNVVELVSTLTELGFLPKEDLLHSSNGREFLTRERLRREVREAVIGRQPEGGGSGSGGSGGGGSGRLPLVELPALLGVDLLHCERAAREAVAEEDEGGGEGGRAKESGGGGLQLIGDGSELVSRAYLDAVVGEVGELLRGGAGAVSLADLCARFALGADELTRLLERATAARGPGEAAAAGPRSPPLLEARLDGGFLVTAAAAARARAALRGALRGATAPVQLSALAKSLGIDPRVLAGAGGAGAGGASGGGGGGGGLAAVVEGLVRSGEVRGALRGGGASFAPELHSRAVAAASAAFYAQNGYVEVSGGGSGANPAASLPEGAVLLPSGAVAAAPALVAQVEAAVEDAAASVSSSSSAADPSSPLWVDVSSLGVIPAALSRGDARALLLRAPAAEKLLLAAKGASAAAAAAAVPVPDSQGGSSSSASPRPPPLLLAGTCVVSGAMLLSLRERARELALAEAAKVISEGRRAKASSSSSAKAAASASDVAPATAAAAAASNASKGPKTGDGDDDEDWSMGGKSKKKGGAAGKKNKGGGGASSSSRAGPAAAASSKKATISTPSSSPSDAALSLAALAEAVERWHPGTSEAGIGGGGEDGDEDGDEEDDEAGEGRRQRSSSLAWALAALLRPVALAAFDAAVADAASSGADSRKKSREALLAAAVDAGDRLQLYARGAEALAAVGGKPGGGGGDRGGSGGDAAAAAASAAAAEAISRHLILRGPGVEAADALLRVLAFDAAADEGGAGGGEKSPFAELPRAEGKGAPLAPPLSPSERAALVASLPPTGSSSSRAEAAALVDALASSDVPALVDALEAATAAAGSRFRRLERKAEKALAAAARRSLEDALRRETSPAAALPLAASVALARLRPGRAVPPVPGRALGFLLGALASALAKEEEGGGGGSGDGGDGGDGEEKGDASSSAPSSSSAAAVTALFKKFHGLVVASLKSSGEGEKGSSEQLEALLPSLKRAALGEKEDGE